MSVSGIGLAAATPAVLLWLSARSQARPARRPAAAVPALSTLPARPGPHILNPVSRCAGLRNLVKCGPGGEG